MSIFLPNRGDLVSFHDAESGLDELYYFQPNGHTCYLYEFKENLGDRFYAKHTPMRRSVHRPTYEQLSQFPQVEETRRAVRKKLTRHIIVYPYPTQPYKSDNLSDSLGNSSNNSLGNSSDDSDDSDDSEDSN